MIKITKTKQKGQALLFVVVAVTIAMAVGVSVSTRTLDLVRRISRTDTSARVIAASEGGMERLLTQSENTLDNLETPNPDCSLIDANATSYADGKCIISFPTPIADKITATAVVDSEKFQFNGIDINGIKNYWFNLDPGYVKEVNLDGYLESTIEICWDSPGAAVYFFSYSKPDFSGNVDIKRGGFYSANFPVSSKEAVSGFTQAGQNGKTQYTGCGTINLVKTPYESYGLRIKTFYESSKIYVYPTGDSFPYQGYKLISQGKLSVDNDVTDSKTINVYRSYTYSPSMFDYALYTEGSLN
jgi:hypothetical protein